MIRRRVFYSFHYAADSWRAAMVRNIGVVEGNRPATDNNWEEVTRGGARGDQEVDRRTDEVAVVHTGPRGLAHGRPTLDKVRDSQVMGTMEREWLGFVFTVCWIRKVTSHAGDGIRLLKSSLTAQADTSAPSILS